MRQRRPASAALEIVPDVRPAVRCTQMLARTAERASARRHAALLAWATTVARMPRAVEGVPAWHLSLFAWIAVSATDRCRAWVNGAMFDDFTSRPATVSNNITHPLWRR